MKLERASSGKSERSAEFEWAPQCARKQRADQRASERARESSRMEILKGRATLSARRSEIGTK